MDLQEILKEYGMSVGDIKSRISTGSIKLNGEEVSNPRSDLGKISEVRDFGKFMRIIEKEIDFNKYKNQLMLMGFDDLMSGESNIQNELTEFLKDWMLVRTSTSSGFFMKKGEPSDKGVLFDIDGQVIAYRTIVESPKEQSVDIEKLKKDLSDINKQLSNPGFLKNAPQFKLDAAKSKKERIEKQLSDAGVSESLRFIKKFKNF
jgi:valyl-tRNA synthetase